MKKGLKIVENFLKYLFLNGLVIREMSDLWLRLLHHDYWPRGWVHSGALSSINIIFTSTYNYFNWLSFQRNRLKFNVLPGSYTFVIRERFNSFSIKKTLTEQDFSALLKIWLKSAASLFLYQLLMVLGGYTSCQY